MTSNLIFKDTEDSSWACFSQRRIASAHTGFNCPLERIKKFISKLLARTRIIKPEQTATMCREKIPTKILKYIVLDNCSDAYFKTKEKREQLLRTNW